MHRPTVFVLRTLWVDLSSGPPPIGEAHRFVDRPIHGV